MADAGRSRRARTTADGGSGRGLSELSDDLLRHIVFLAPDKDGAATAVLSRRWRWLWRTSGVVHVNSRSFCPSGRSYGADDDKKTTQGSEAFVRGAEKAISAATAHGPIRRLTFFIAEDSRIILLPVRRWTKGDYQYQRKRNLMEAIVSNPAARRVEELQILVKPFNTGFKLRFSTLPFEALRVLRIHGCETLTAGGAASIAFPMLEDLNLKHCNNVSLADLQRIIHAAPLLSKLYLASSQLYEKSSLVIPTVTVLELADCRYGCLELDVPRMQFFRYRGPVNGSDRLSLKSQASDLHVDLQFKHGPGHCFTAVPTTTRESFWRFIRSFSTTKHLKLRVDCSAMEGLTFIDDKASRDELLGGLSFSPLEQLELEAEYYTGFEPLLANFLHCYPMLRDLRIKLIKKAESPWTMSASADNNNEAGTQFDKSVSGFRNRRRRSMVSLRHEKDDDYQDYGVIPGLTSEQQSFSCLQSHLKRVSLHFFKDEPNCLGVKLAMFFAKNAKVLQELHIDDGSHEMLEHANSSVRRWIANTDIYGNNQLNVKY